MVANKAKQIIQTMSLSEVPGEDAELLSAEQQVEIILKAAKLVNQNITTQDIENAGALFLVDIKEKLLSGQVNLIWSSYSYVTQNLGVDPSTLSLQLPEDDQG